MATDDPKVFIDAPDLLTPRERARDTLMTAGMWGAYIYLWVPLISLFAWLLGFEFAYDVMVRAGGARDLVRALVIFALVIAVILGTVATWSYSNRLRYRGHNRRQTGPRVLDSQMAEYFRVDEATLAKLRVAHRIELGFDADGRPELRGD
jgi:biofilm PGA synthesis protein PgaD